MTRRAKKIIKIVSITCGFILLFPLVVWLMGAHNPSTPAGYCGYITQGSIFGEKKFVGIQKGPISTGRHWLYNVVNVSITPYTTSEQFINETGVLAKDNLHVDFQTHIVWKINNENIKQLVEEYSTSHQDSELERSAYNNFLREPLRTFARDEIQAFDALLIKDNIKKIGNDITNNIRKYCENSPFEILSVVVGNIQYPKEVSDQVSIKMAATQILERKQIEIDQERMDAKKRIIQAEGIAKSMEIINNQLSDKYLQHEAIEAQKTMADSPNHTTVYIPVGNNGIPIVKTMD